VRMHESQLYGAWRMWPPASSASLRWQIRRVEQTGVHVSPLWGAVSWHSFHRGLSVNNSNFLDTL